MKTGMALCEPCVWLLLLFCAMILFSAGCDKASKSSVLIITGGHGFERDAFFAMFDSYADVAYTEIEHPAANDIYGSPDINNYDVLVFYDMVQDINETQQQQMLALLDQGKGMVFLHHSLVSYQQWDEFGKIIGGRYHLEREGSDITPSTYKHDVKLPVQIVDKKHPVTRGLENFVIHDEAYGGFTVRSDVRPLLTTTHEDNGETIAWTNQYKNARIVYLQLGHDHFAYEDANYRKLVNQAIKWVQKNDGDTN